MEFLKLCWYVVRRRWPVVLVSLAVFLAGAVAMNNIQTPTYTASAEMFLRAPDVKTSASAYQGDLFSRQRAQSYMNLFTSDDLARSVIDKLNLPMSAADLESKVSAANIKDTVIIVVSAVDGDPQQAANIANGYASVFDRYVARMENVEYDPTVKPLVSVVKTATADSAVRSGYSMGVILAVAVLLSLFVSALLIYLLERTDTRLRSRRQIEELAGAPVVATFGVEIMNPDNVAALHRTGGELSEPVRRALVGVRSRLSLIPDGQITQRNIVAVVSDSAACGGSGVAAALAAGSAAIRDSTCLVRIGTDSSLPSPASGDGRGSLQAELGADPGVREGAVRTIPRSGAPVVDLPDEVVISFADAHLSQGRERIAELGKESDLVLIDAPALTESAASDITMESAGSVLIVVSPGKTTKVALAEAAAKAGTLGRPVIGVVVTRARETSTLHGIYI